MFYWLRLITFATAIKWRRPLNTNAMQFWIFSYLTWGVMWKRLKVRCLKDDMIRRAKGPKLEKQRWQTRTSWPSSPWDNLVFVQWRQHSFWWNLDMRFTYLTEEIENQVTKAWKLQALCFKSFFGPFRSLNPYTSNDRNHYRNARWQLQCFATLKLF